ncbi:hypothetical protein Pfo_005989, partial [Paulownia fortunei]
HNNIFFVVLNKMDKNAITLHLRNSIFIYSIQILCCKMKHISSIAKSNNQQTREKHDSKRPLQHISNNIRTTRKTYQNCTLSVLLSKKMYSSINTRMSGRARDTLRNQIMKHIYNNPPIRQPYN